VRPLEVPRGTKFIFSSHNWGTDDVPEIDYWVGEQVPTGSKSSSSEEAAVSELLDKPYSNDDRQFMLKLDLSSVEVHHVTGVSFDTEPHRVTRHRFTKEDWKL
jgi:hypothetical protein